MLGLLEYTQKPEVKPHVPNGIPPPVPLMISSGTGRLKCKLVFSTKTGNAQFL
jgi:hypothetical protein